MKFFAFAIVASLAFTVTVAAPYDLLLEIESSELLEPFERVAAYDEFPELFEIEKQLYNQTINLECVINAIHKVIEDNNLTQLWEITRRRLRETIQRLQACPNNGNLDVIRRCILRELGNIRGILYEFYYTLFAQDRLDIVRKIREEIIRQCRASYQDEMEPEVRLIQESNYTPSQGEFIEYLKCLWNVVNQVVSETNEEIGTIWSDTKEELSDVIEQLKQCKKLPEGEVSGCVRRQVEAGARILGRFVRALIQEGFGSMLSEIQKQVSEKCRDGNTFQSLGSAGVY